jgi:uncharacterized protein
MTLSMHTMAVGSFVPMLTSLDAILERGAVFSEAHALDLVQARLAPDMYTLAQQVQQACHYATDAAARLAGRPSAPTDDAQETFAAVRDQIARTLETLSAAPAAAFEGAEQRDCSIEIGGDRVIEMDGERFLRAWSLPHFYFHVVTAYDILRHHGVQIGKMDYESQVGGFIRAK